MGKKKHAWNFIDRTGIQYGRLLVIKEVDKKDNKVVWECLCDCGNTTYVKSEDLTKGTKSCGCLQKEKTSKAKFVHGLKGTSEHHAWSNMKRRCYDKTNNRYATYGGRGIKVCDRWLGKHGFLNFLTDMGKKPLSALTLERRNNDGDYCPENCYWANQKVQARNKTTSRIIKYNGESRILEEWGEITGFGKKVIWQRLNLGWSVEDALTKPIRGFNKNDT